MKDALLSKFRDRTAPIGIIGQGYVGLPLALVFEEAGFPVIGFDVDPRRSRRCPGRVLHQAHRRRAGRGGGASGRFSATTDFDGLRDCDAILICVPTPLGKHREPDISLHPRHRPRDREAAAHGPARRARVDDLPGHHRRGGAADPRGERARSCGRDFFLAFSPEREDPGNARLQHQDHPEGRGRGGRRTSTERRGGPLPAGVDKVVPVSSSRVAEAAKLLENIFRSVNIALVNELKIDLRPDGHRRLGGHRGGQDQAVRLHAVLPGPGPGRALHPARPVLPVVEGGRVRAVDALHRAGGRDQHLHAALRGRPRSPRRSTRTARALKGRRCWCWASSYKANIDDDRESPSYEIIELLQERARRWTTATRSSRRRPSAASTIWAWSRCPARPRRSRGYDALVVSTAHNQFKDPALYGGVALVVDTRNMVKPGLPDGGGPKRVVKA